MNKILVEVSVGELLDKISILEIKKEKISDLESLKIINSEYLVLKEQLTKNIKTNSEVDFYIEDKSYSLKEGVWYEINNQKNHSVINKSSMDRVHLIVDILPNHLNIITNNFCL